MMSMLKCLKQAVLIATIAAMPATALAEGNVGFVYVSPIGDAG